MSQVPRGIRAHFGHRIFSDNGGIGRVRLSHNVVRSSLTGSNHLGRVSSQPSGGAPNRLFIGRSAHIGAEHLGHSYVSMNRTAT